MCCRREWAAWVRVYLCGLGPRRPDIQRAAFLTAIHLAPTRLFEFQDASLEANYFASHSLSKTGLRSLQIIFTWIFYLPCFLYAVLSLDADVTPLTWICGLGVMTLLVTTLLLVCHIRRQELRRVKTAFAHFVSSDAPLDENRADVRYLMVSPRKKPPTFRPVTATTEPVDAETDHTTAVEEETTKKTCSTPQWIVDLCCSEFIIVAILCLASINVLVWHVFGIHLIQYEEERSTRMILYMLITLSNWCVLTCCVSGKSLYISSAKCVWIATCQLIALVVPPVMIRVWFGNFLAEELLTMALSLMTMSWVFFAKFRLDLSSRMLFFLLWRTNEDDTEKKPPFGGAHTGVEDVLGLLEEIIRLATKASAAPPGSLITSDHLIRVLVKANDAQGLLLKQQDLYKVRVKGGGDQAMDFARMYGMDVGESNSPEPPPLLSHRFGSIKLDNVIRFADGYETARPMHASAERSMHTARLRSQYSKFVSTVSPREIIRGVTRRPPRESLDSSVRVTTSWSSATTRSSEWEDADLEALGGFMPDELPKRKLTRQLADVVGCTWTLDLHRLNEECGGNILVEVGYTLLGQKLTTILDTFPELLDPKILDAFGNENHIQFGCFQHFTLISFLYGLQQQYRPLPYHNAVHAAHVAHSCACLTNYLSLSGGSAYTPGVELAVTLATLGHDVGHPGRNNQYFVNSYDPLSVLYNDNSILENYHSCLLFMTLELENCNVLFPFTAEVFRQIRQMIIKLILSTDMKCHFEHVSRFKLRCSDPDFNPYTEPADLSLILELCIKAGDLAASVCSWDIHRDWCFRVVEEFYRQGEEEQNLNLPISPLCDRNKHDVEFAKSQASFIEFVTAPMFDHFLAFDPTNFQLKELTTVLQGNKANWKRLVDQPVTIPIHIRDAGRISDMPKSTKRSWQSVVGDLKGSTPVVGTAVKKFKLDERKSIRRSTALTLRDEVSHSSVSSKEEDREESSMMSPMRGSVMSSTRSLMIVESASFFKFPSSVVDQMSPLTLDRRRSVNFFEESSTIRRGEFQSCGRRVEMPRDQALSPSARLGMFCSSDDESSVEVIRRRASVLQPVVSTDDEDH